MSMEKVSLFGKNDAEEEDDATASSDAPNVPLSPMKKTKEVEAVLSQYDDYESKLIALAQIMKKDRKKTKSLKQALIKEIEK